MVHGKSVSRENVYGLRRKAIGEDGKIHILAPKHFRRLGKRYMEDIADGEIGKFYFNFDIESMKKSISAAKGVLTKAELDALKQIKTSKDAGIQLTDEEINKIKNDITANARQKLSEKESVLANAEALIREFMKTAD